MKVAEDTCVPLSNSFANCAVDGEREMQGPDRRQVEINCLETINQSQYP